MSQALTFQTNLTNRPAKLENVDNLLAYSNEKVTDDAGLKGRVCIVGDSDERVLIIAETVLCDVPEDLDMKQKFTTTLQQETHEKTLWSVFTFTQNGEQLGQKAYEGELTLVEAKKNGKEDKSANGYSYPQILAAAVSLLAVVALGTYFTGSFPFNAQKA